MSVAVAAKEVYEADLRKTLELSNMNEFVAIEPVSRRYFVGRTFLDAALTAKNAFPDRKSFVIRVGHDTAIHIGTLPFISSSTDYKREVARCKIRFCLDGERWLDNLLRSSRQVSGRKDARY
ncbi:MAG: hypothetical protein SGI77_18265 [Pirellulaceae bacterium]|nr:hypothetical protein [Pirellulaceae bacterium]